MLRIKQTRMPQNQKLVKTMYRADHVLQGNTIQQLLRYKSYKPEHVSHSSDGFITITF